MNNDLKKLFEDVRNPELRRPDWLERNEWWLFPMILIIGSFPWVLLALLIIKRFVL